MKIVVFLLFTGLALNFEYAPVHQQQALQQGEISFEFVSKGVKGTIGGFQSKSTLDLEQIENSTFEGSVAVATLDTNNGLRNWSLKGRKYFDEDEHPKIRFKSKTVEVSSDGFVVKGTLTLKGISKPFNITFKKEGPLLRGKATLYTSDFDIHIKKKREDNLVNINFVFEID